MDDPSGPSEDGKSGKRKRTKKDECEPRKIIDEIDYEVPIVWKELNGDEFKKEFRISRETFDFVCELIKEPLENIVNACNTPEERVAVALWRLANGADFKQAAKRLSVTDYAAKNFPDEVYELIDSNLRDKHLSWPTEDDQARIKEEFEKVSAIPKIIGHLYTTHLLIRKQGEKDPAAVDPRLTEEDSAAINPRLTERFRKKARSIPFQGVVDSQGKFIHVFCCDEVLGNKTDQEVLEKSKVLEKVASGDYMVGGETYVLDDRLMVPYKMLPVMPDMQSMFNSKTRIVRRIAMKAFQKLLRRWSFLKKPINVDRRKITRIVRVCCILHNICRDRKDKADGFARLSDSLTPVTPGIPSVRAMSVRDAIAKDVLHLSFLNLHPTR